MKLDKGISRVSGLRGVIPRAVAAVLGLAGLATGGLADDFAGLADPTQPYNLATGKRPASGMAGSALQSTFVSASQRRAVINGRTYKVGDRYGGGIIADIQPYEVVVKKANNETRLRLLPKLAKETHGVKVPASGRKEGKK